MLETVLPLNPPKNPLQGVGRGWAGDKYTLTCPALRVFFRGQHWTQHPKSSQAAKTPWAKPLVWGEFGKWAQNCTVQILHISTGKKILFKDYFKAVFFIINRTDSAPQSSLCIQRTENLKSGHAALGVETHNSQKNHSNVQNSKLWKTRGIKPVPWERT